MAVELYIENDLIAYAPLIEEGIEWTTERMGSPGKLTFTVIKDDIINFQEGNVVKLVVDGQKLFFGFVFTKKRDKNQQISVTAYDQLRYLKNKDTYIYTNKTASDVIKMVAADFNLNLGTIENTEFAIASRVESNITLFDVILNALDQTLMNTKNLYVLYDEFGALTLKSLESMKIGLVVDEETGENFNYTTSIDEATYNIIKYAYTADESTETKVVFSPQPIYENGKQTLSKTQKQWGILQYFLIEDGVVMTKAQAQAKADALLSLYNTKTRSLKIPKALGDCRVRAGSMIIVNLNLGDMRLQNFMLVEKCIHRFKNGEHFMDLSLRGGEFVE